MKLRRLGAFVVTINALAPGLAAAHPDDPDVTLDAATVRRAFEPNVPAVRDCYVTLARGKTADGTLRLDLIIHRDGTIFQFAFAAPGVEPPALGKLGACLQALVPSWHFPERKGFTTAVLPFLFQQTHAPGAGPVESCWDARGCPPGVAKGGR